MSGLSPKKEVVYLVVIKRKSVERNNLWIHHFNDINTTLQLALNFMTFPIVFYKCFHLVASVFELI